MDYICYYLGALIIFIGTIGFYLGGPRFSPTGRLFKTLFQLSALLIISSLVAGIYGFIVVLSSILLAKILIEMLNNFQHYGSGPVCKRFWDLNYATDGEKELARTTNKKAGWSDWQPDSNL